MDEITENREAYEHKIQNYVNRLSYYVGRLAATHLEGLTQVEFILLHEIYTQTDCNPKGEVIVGRLMCNVPHNKSAISKMLGCMEKKELVTRRPCPENRRNVLVGMTDKGWALFRKNDLAEQERCRRTFDAVGRERVMQMFETLDECLRTRLNEREPEEK